MEHGTCIVENLIQRGLIWCLLPSIRTETWYFGGLVYGKGFFRMHIILSRIPAPNPFDTNFIHCSKNAGIAQLWVPGCISLTIVWSNSAANEIYCGVCFLYSTWKSLRNRWIFPV